MFSKNEAVIEQMNKAVVVSLYTDGGPQAEKFKKLQEEMTQSVTQPVYVIADPETMEPLGIFDYNQAVKSDFAERIGKSLRRFQRGRASSPGRLASSK